jgi:phage-related protein
LNDVEAAQVLRELRHLQTAGTDLGMPHVRRMQGTELWELRIRGRVQHRIFYVALQGRRMLLLHSFAKKSHATPLREIATAESRLLDYRRRNG